MDNYNYDSSFNIRLCLFWTGEWIIDVEKEQPDLLGKHGLGRELKIKGFYHYFIGGIIRIGNDLYPDKQGTLIYPNVGKYVGS